MDLQRILIGLGLLLVVAGSAWPLIVKLGLGRLPGDMVFQREGFSLYLPIATSILLSIVLSAAPGASRLNDVKNAKSVGAIRIRPPRRAERRHALRVSSDLQSHRRTVLGHERARGRLPPSLGPVFMGQLHGAPLGAPLQFNQSALLVWPQLTGLVAAVVVLFTAAYVLFQRQEVRA